MRLICVCCHRVHGGRIRRAGTVPGGAASGQDLGVFERFDLQTSRQVEAPVSLHVRALAAMDAVDAPPHAIHTGQDLRRLQREEGLRQEEGPRAAAEGRGRARGAAGAGAGAGGAPAPDEGQGQRAREPPPPPPPARKSDGPELDSGSKGQAALLGVAPFAVLPVLGLVGARGALTQGKKQREAEQQAAIRARQAQELAPLQQKAVFGLPAVAAASLAGLFAVGPITDAVKPAPPAKGKKAVYVGQGPVTPVWPRTRRLEQINPSRRARRCL